MLRVVSQLEGGTAPDQYGVNSMENDLAEQTLLAVAHHLGCPNGGMIAIMICQRLVRPGRDRITYSNGCTL